MCWSPINEDATSHAQCRCTCRQILDAFVYSWYATYAHGDGAKP